MKHESPQAFYFVDGKVVWNASHSDINVSTLAQVKNKKDKYIDLRVWYIFVTSLLYLPFYHFK